MMSTTRGMLVITHVRLDGRGRFYENIIEVWCEGSETSTSSVTTPIPKALSVARLIAEIRRGTRVLTTGNPMVEVEIFEVYGREYIRSKLGTEGGNDLLSLPRF